MAERRIKFVSAVTHELRTPLTSLRLYLDLLVSGMIQDEAKKQEYLKTLTVESVVSSDQPGIAHINVVSLDGVYVDLEDWSQDVTQRVPAGTDTQLDWEFQAVNLFKGCQVRDTAINRAELGKTGRRTSKTGRDISIASNAEVAELADAPA